MKPSLLCGIAFVCATAVSAQTAPPNTAATQNPAGSPGMARTTVTGCVAGGGSASQPITMTSPTIVPPTAQPAALNSSPPAAPVPPVPGATPPSPGSQPPVTPGVTPRGMPPVTPGVTPPPAPPGTPPATAPGVTPPPAPPAVPPNPPTATGTTGATAAGTTGSAGSVAAPASPVTSPEGGAAGSGYRLTGTDMNAWVGQRVQIVGTIVPSSSKSGEGSPSAAAGSTPMQEFRVQSVQMIPGSCPPQ
jgi:hypothetical protein